jgi:hypothetical protein
LENTMKRLVLAALVAWLGAIGTASALALCPLPPQVVIAGLDPA